MKKNITLFAALVFLYAGAVWADTKISQMPSGGSLSSGDIIPILRGGSNFQATYSPSASGVSSFTGDGIVFNNSASTGAVTLSTANQAANTFHAGPTTGAAAPPTFRALVNGDIPAPSLSALGGVEAINTVTHQWISSITTGGIPQLTQPAFSDLSGTIAAGQELLATATVPGSVMPGGSCTVSGAGALSCSATGSLSLGSSVTGVTPQIAGDATSGFWTNGPAKIDVAISGVNVTEWTSTGVATTGSNTSNSFIPSGSTVPTDGLYLPAANSSGIADNSAAVLKTIGVASGVDFVKITNSATGNPGNVIIQATGSDANVGLQLKSTGTGGVSVAGANYGTSAFTVNEQDGTNGNGLTIVSSPGLNNTNADFALKATTSANGNGTVYGYWDVAVNSGLGGAPQGQLQFFDAKANTTPLIISEGSSNASLVVAAGKVGIALATIGTVPAQALEVNGIARMDTSLQIGTKLTFSATSPTVSSGFGTSPSIVTANGTAAFTLNVGTGGSATSGVIGLPTASTGWNCRATDTSNDATLVTSCVPTSTTTTTCSSYSRTTGTSTAWSASDVLAVACVAY